MLIASSDNNKIKLLRSLINQKKARKEHRLFVVEGATLYKECPSLFIQEAFVRQGDVELLNLAKSKCNKVYEVESHIFDNISDVVTPSGIMAIVSYNVENCSIGNKILLLDGVKDPGNVGTLLRTAAGFNMDTVLLVDTADPYSPKVVRSTMGAIFKLGILELSRESAFDIIKEHEVFALDMGGEDLRSIVAPCQFVLAVGNEAHGISPQLRERADKIVAIKADGIESLNAAIAGAIAMFHFTK